MSDQLPSDSPGSTYQLCFRITSRASLYSAVASWVLLLAPFLGHVERIVGMEESSWFFVIGYCAFISNMAGFVSLALAKYGWSTSRLSLYSRWLHTVPFVFLALIPSGYLGWMVCAFSSLPDKAELFASNGVLSGVGFIVSLFVGWITFRVW